MTGQFKHVTRQDYKVHQRFKIGFMSKQEHYLDPLSEVGLAVQNNKYHAYGISPELSLLDNLHEDNIHLKVFRNTRYKERVVRLSL